MRRDAHLEVASLKLIRIVAVLAVVALAMPARADVILTYHLSNFNPPTQGDTLATGTPIPANDPLGPLITGPLTFYPGQTRYIQIAIQANANSPTMVNGQNQFNWTTANSGNTMTTFALGFLYPGSLVAQPFTQPMPPQLNQNQTNATALTGPQPMSGGPTGYAFTTGYPNFTWTPGFPFPYYITCITGTDSVAGLGVSPTGYLSDTPLCILKIRAGTSLGSGFITMQDLNTAPTAVGFGLLDGTNLDPIIFASAHANFPLQVIVTAPEPSSLCLAGVAVAGFGWRRWRRKGASKVCDPVHGAS